MGEGRYRHMPVMLEKAVAYLRPERGGTFLDGTIGGGGHAERLLQAAPDVRLIGLDIDPAAVAAAENRLREYGDRVRLLNENFRNSAGLLAGYVNEKGLAGALLDVGVSSIQIDDTARGFSFRRSTPLVMRMGGTAGEGRPAADFLNSASEQELGRVFREYGEERKWRAVAREIVRRRRAAPLESSDDLVAALTAALRRSLSMRDKARLFQAVRIAVNDELGALQEGLDGIRELLGPGGRLVVITYHSLEDRIVKDAFREWSRSCVCPPGVPECRCRGVPLGLTLTRRPIRPSAEEVSANPRARSAKLRAWERA
ncbi:MAG: 16S rRNA (cytosine(1402)-N(4))-methyltransferase RsmH [Gemmatimonadota bacterium]